MEVTISVLEFDVVVGAVGVAWMLTCCSIDRDLTTGLRSH